MRRVFVAGPFGQPLVGHRRVDGQRLAVSIGRLGASKSCVIIGTLTSLIMISMNRSLTRCATVAALLAGIVGCADRGPYAEVVGDSYAVSDGFEGPVLITAVDDLHDLKGTDSKVLEPGPRSIQVSSVRRGQRGNHIIEYSARIAIDAKPCMRYHVVAVHRTMLWTGPFKPVLKREEPIAECASKFQATK